jgi:hypothetical protein
MAFPAIAMAVAAGAQVASTIASVKGAQAQAKAQSQTADYNAQVANQNAYIANQQADAISQQQQRIQAQHMGAMIASYGASGIEADTGSAMDVLADSAARMQLDNMTTKYNYQLRAMGFSNQAMLDQSASKNYLTAGNTTAWAYGLKGVADTASMVGKAYMGFNNPSSLAASSDQESY